MATDFSSQQLRKVIVDLEADDSRHLQKFELRASDVNVLRMFYDQRDACLSGADIESIENLRSTEQTLDLNVYDNELPGAGTSRKRIGSGGSGVGVVVPSFFDEIVEEFDMSFVNQIKRQYGGESENARTAIARAYSEHMKHEMMIRIRNIYTRANEQYVAFLEAQKWALSSTPDAGTIYTTFTADTKDVPEADITGNDVIQNMSIEYTQNNFNVLGRPALVHSPKGRKVVMDYNALGPANSENVRQYLNWFDPYEDNEITDVNATDNGTAYLVAGGGVAGYQRTTKWDAHPDAVNGEVNTGEDSWFNITVGGPDSGIFSDVPPLQLEVKTFQGYSDTSGTYVIDEANIDIIKGVVLTANFGALKSHTSNTDQSTIIKYTWLGS